MSDKNGDLGPIIEQPVFVQVTPPTSQPRRLFDPLRCLRDHTIASIGVFLVIILAGGFVMHRRAQLYTTESIVYVSPTSPTELTDDQQGRQYDQFFQQQIYAVTRPDNLKKAIEADSGFWKFPGEDEQSAILRLQRSLKVEQMGASYQMSISLESAKRQGLAEFVNSITSGYLETAHNDEFYGRDKQIAVLRQQQSQLSDQLDDDLHKQDDLLDGLGIAQIDEKGGNNPYNIQLAALRDQLAAAHEKRDEADAQVYALTESPTGKKTPGAQPDNLAIGSDPGVAAIETQLSARRVALMLQMIGLTPQNPLYVQSQTELDTINQQLKEIEAQASDKAISKLSAERERAGHLESQLNSDLSKAQRLAANVTPTLQQAEKLSAEITRLQANATAVDNRISNLLLESNAPGSEHIVSPATIPSEVVSKNAVIYLIALLMAGLLGAVAIALLLDAVDPNVYTAAQIRSLLGFSPIGMLLCEADFPTELAKEYMLRLAAGIDQAHRKTGARTFLFTSAGGGNTHNLVQTLGSELAANGLTTLVVLIGNKQLNKDPKVAAFNEINLNQAKSSVDSSLILASGVDLSTKALKVVSKAPEGVAEFIRNARASYSTVLVGADPLLVSAHSEHLARITDGTVVVAESGEVTKNQLSRVARLLERLKIPGIAVVLSDIKQRRADREILENAAEYAQRGIS